MSCASRWWLDTNIPTFWDLLGSNTLATCTGNLKKNCEHRNRTYRKNPCLARILYEDNNNIFIIKDPKIKAAHKFTILKFREERSTHSGIHTPSVFLV